MKPTAPSRRAPNAPSAPVDVLCLLGFTGPVLTELAWALADDGVAVHDLCVVTTEDALPKLADVIVLAADGRTAGPGPKLEALWKQEPATRPLGKLRIARLSVDDSVDAEANRRVGSEIYAALRLAVASERALIACLTGGRKSMSAWLAIGMGLLAREDDRLVHVTVARELERPGFWFPRTAAERKKVALATVPFVRVGPLLPASARPSFDAAVTAVTRRVGELKGPRLVVDAPCEVVIEGERARLPPRAWALLAFYCERAEKGDAEVAWVVDVRARQRLDELWSRARDARPVGRGQQKLAKLDFEFADNRVYVEKAHASLRRELSVLAPELASAIVSAERAAQGLVYRIPASLRAWLRASPRRD